MKKMKFKYKALFGFSLATAFVIVVQLVMQFNVAYKFVGFEKRDQSSWISIAEVAQAQRNDAQDKLDQCMQDKQTAEKAANPDLFK